MTLGKLFSLLELNFSVHQREAVLHTGVKTLQLKMWVKSSSGDITDVHLLGLEGVFCPTIMYSLENLTKRTFTFKTEQYSFQSINTKNIVIILCFLSMS